ncbi:MAG: hypothetical protein JWM27_2783 [Gemmatimonadetes bacterium]|nr:hypothetical protein [Gemmatimonadota bacterium]
MTRRIGLAAAVLLLAACKSPQPATSPRTVAMDSARAAEVMRGPGQAPPIFGLLGQREKLNLTSAQIVSLDSIGEDLHARNEPINRHLRALQDSLGGRDRMSERTRRELLDRGAPLYTELRTNNRRAAESVHAVLTTDQRDATCRMLREDRDQRTADASGRGRNRRGAGTGGGGGGGGYGRQGGMAGRGGMYGDTLRMSRSSDSALYWCAPDTTHRPAARTAADTARHPAHP